MVDLPEPDAPTRAHVFPAGNEMLRSVTTGTLGRDG